MFFNKIHIRIKVVLLLVIIVLLSVTLKVAYVQVLMQKKLSKLSGDLYNRNLVISADRGIITDRNGKVIASNITTSSLVLVPVQIKNREEVAKKLSEILSCSYEQMYKHVSKKTSIEVVHPEGKNLDSSVAEKIKDLNYEGVYLVKESKRYYPYGNLLSHTLGYVGIMNQGLSGIELEYDKYLTGTNGSIKYFSDGKGNKLNKSEIYSSPTNGLSLSLTIDLDLQLAVENELDKVMSKYNADNALIIVEDPNTGEILAIASRPDFDSNNYQDYNTEVINRNLPIWKTYEPGSTFKIVTLASALEENALNLFEDTYTDTGVINVSGSKLHCWKHEGHGTQTYLQVVENSCNPGFVSMGQMIGKNTLMSYIEKFGFGKKTGIDLNGEATGILFDIDKMGPVETATTSFGQGISVTPIQQINAVSAIVNGGDLLKPYIVKNIYDESTKTIVKNFSKEIKGKTVSEETSKLVKYALESVVANGTGHNAYIENYRVGGKTGTAQKVVDGTYSSSSYILSFIGFMPADDPQMVIYVAVDGAKGVTQYGGTVSAPIAKNVMETAIPILNIKSSKDVMPKEYSWLDTKYIKIPSVINKSVKEAKDILQGFNLVYSGTGDKVIYQTPQEDTYVKEGGTINLLLD